jgi:hypothetical protein
MKNSRIITQRFNHKSLVSIHPILNSYRPRRPRSIALCVLQAGPSAWSSMSASIHLTPNETKRLIKSLQWALKESAKLI